MLRRENKVDKKVRDTIDVSASTEASATAATEAPETGPTVSAPDNASALPPEELERLTEELIAAFKSVFDPEIPVDIYELGLIYRVDVDDERDVDIEMTLTAPGCPVAGEMPIWVENAARSVEGVREVKVNLTFDPPWDPSRMSDVARLELNMF